MPVPGGETAVHCVAAAQVTFVAGAEPNATVVPPEAVLKPPPSIVTVVPPVLGPWSGKMPVTIGIPYAYERLLLVPPGVVIVTETVPLPGGLCTAQTVPVSPVQLTPVAEALPKRTSGAGPG